MKKTIAFLIFLLFLILAWFSWKWYKNTVVCCDESASVETETNIKETPQTKPHSLAYNWDSNDPDVGELWTDKKIEILKGNKPGKVLSIVGQYYEGEVNTTSFDNIGLARAEAARKLLSDSIDPSRIEISGKLMDNDENSKTNQFEGNSFSWKTKNENIKQVGNKALIYFPSNSSKKIDNSNITNYLKEVASGLKPNQKIVVTGHTDDQGRTSVNRRIARKRANSIKDLLIEYGVSASKITALSEGEESPIATNDTEEGRQKNRRVELEIK